METAMKADIFFVISTVAVICISVGFSIALVYIIIFLRNLTQLSKRVKEESEVILQDVDALRVSIKTDGFKMRHAVNFFRSFAGRKRKEKSE